MTQYRYTSNNFITPDEGLIPDAVLDQEDQEALNELVGIPNTGRAQRRFNTTQTLSDSANKKAQQMRDLNIKPGTPEWFQLWFSRS